MYKRLLFHQINYVTLSILLVMLKLRSIVMLDALSPQKCRALAEVYKDITNASTSGLKRLYIYDAAFCPSRPLPCMLKLPSKKSQISGRNIYAAQTSCPEFSIHTPNFSTPLSQSRRR
jgi:hypothetical protein